ncbi:unnamed protein product [Protopolystoma xenopodis]|uniref:Uncharacterized protein n=1 Tax=Protopolystoma xenopodis TaxID=117903 RepID=A0A448WNZ3_9PLAT|nr:unnamed protein product [Protopolystoma xenopodis]
MTTEAPVAQSGARFSCYLAPKQRGNDNKTWRKESILQCNSAPWTLLASEDGSGGEEEESANRQIGKSQLRGCGRTFRGLSESSTKPGKWGHASCVHVNVFLADSLRFILTNGPSRFVKVDDCLHSNEVACSSPFWSEAKNSLAVQPSGRTRTQMRPHQRTYTVTNLCVRHTGSHNQPNVRQADSNTGKHTVTKIDRQIDR